VCVRPTRCGRDVRSVQTAEDVASVPRRVPVDIVIRTSGEHPGVVLVQFVAQVPEHGLGEVGVVDALDLRRPQQALSDNALRRRLVVAPTLDATVGVHREVRCDTVRVLGGTRLQFGAASVGAVPADAAE